MAKKRGNQVLELLRGVLSIFVLLCHFRVPGEASVYVVATARCAVPFFLILTGYYAYRSSRKESASLAIRKLKDNGWLLLKLSVVYTVVNTLVCYLNGKPLFSWIYPKYFNGKAIKNFLLFNRALFFCSVAYYLFMIIYVLAVYLLLVKCKAVRYAYYAIPVLLVTNLVLSEFLGKSWYFVGNWMLTGLPFFLLGMWFASAKIRLKPGVCLAMCAVGFVSTQIEAYLIPNKDTYVYIGTVFLSVGLFLLAQAWENKKPPQALVLFGSRFSTGIFLYHCAVGYLLKAIFGKLGWKLNNWMWLLVIAITIGVLLLVQFAGRLLQTIKEKRKA